MTQPNLCSTCGQYSHSLGDDAITEAFNHFQAMYAHPVRGHPMGHVFDAKTRDAAQVLMAAARKEAVMTEPAQVDLVGRVARVLHPMVWDDLRPVSQTTRDSSLCMARAAIAAIPAPLFLGDELLRARVVTLDQYVSMLRAQLAAKDEEIARLKSDIAGYGLEIIGKDAQLAAKDEGIAALVGALERISKSKSPAHRLSQALARANELRGT